MSAAYLGLEGPKQGFGMPFSRQDQRVRPCSPWEPSIGLVQIYRTNDFAFTPPL